MNLLIAFQRSTGQRRQHPFSWSRRLGFKSSFHGQPKSGSNTVVPGPPRKLVCGDKTLLKVGSVCGAEGTVLSRLPPPSTALKCHHAFPPPSHLRMFALLRQLYRRVAIRLDFLDAPVTDDTYTPDGHISGAATLASSYRLSVSTCDMLTPSCV